MTGEGPNLILIRIYARAPRFLILVCQIASISVAHKLPKACVHHRETGGLEPPEAKYGCSAKENPLQKTDI